MKNTMQDKTTILEMKQFEIGESLKCKEVQNTAIIGDILSTSTPARQYVNQVDYVKVADIANDEEECLL